MELRGSSSSSSLEILCIWACAKTGLAQVDGRFMEDVLDTFNYETSVEMRSAKGGTSRARVLEQVKVLKAMLA